MNYVRIVIMRIQSAIAAVLILSPTIVMADEYQRGYTTQRSCFRNEYREEYVPGTQSSPGYVMSYTDTIEVPCIQNSWNSVNSYRHHYQHRDFKRNNAIVSKSDRPTGGSCSAGNSTTGGIIGGSLAAILSKKDAYGWSVPLGAVLGMGLANSTC